MRTLIPIIAASGVGLLVTAALSLSILGGPSDRPARDAPTLVEAPAVSVPSTTPDRDVVRSHELDAVKQELADVMNEFGYIVDYRKLDGAYRIVFDDIKDAEDAYYWYERGVDFEVV